MEFFGIDNLLNENYEKIPFEENLSDSFFLEYETTNSILEKKISNNKKREDKNFLKKKDKKDKCKYNLKIFICYCGKIYRSKENVSLHYQNIHLKKKPYKCDFCGCEFSHRNGKTYHVRKFHTKIFPYICPFKESKKIILLF